MLDLVVLGGGISGLVVAWRARREGLSVALLEASDRTGGSIQTLDVDGARFDAGASSLLLRHPRVEAFLDDAGLAGDVLEPGPEVKRRLVLHRGALAALPTGPLSFLATRLFSCRDKLGLLREPWRARAPADREESIADFTRRRLGRSFLANAVGPFVSGVYAGDPERLAVRHAFPAIHALEQEHGSLLRGALARRSGPAPRGRTINFREGMETLPRRLAGALGDTVRRGHRAERVTRATTGATTGFRVEGVSTAGPFSLEASRLVVALPGYALAPALAPLGEAAEAFRDLPFAPVATVFLSYRTEQVGRAPRAFGFLRGLGERDTRILGCLFTSTLWPDRVPAGEAAFTAFLGGRLDPQATTLTPRALTELAARELAPLLAIDGEPVRAAARTWLPAIPQLERGHERFLAAATALEEAHPGLTLVGNFRRGVSVADCIERALSVPIRSRAAEA